MKYRYIGNMSRIVKCPHHKDGRDDICNRGDCLGYIDMYGQCVFYGGLANTEIKPEKYRWLFADVD